MSVWNDKVGGEGQPFGSRADGQSCSVLLMASGTLFDPHEGWWTEFSRCWNDLPRDEWMADGGTYRRRRYAAFVASNGVFKRLSHRPHFQALDHNPLNGGVERWFAPMEQEAAWTPNFLKLLSKATALVERETNGGNDWAIEAHQFRIEACNGAHGLPTPEGMHRDGRDWVLLIYVGGDQFEGGETIIESTTGRILLRHRLSVPGEALLLKDSVARHCTSPIRAAYGTRNGWRDTLVLTFSDNTHAIVMADGSILHLI